MENSTSEFEDRLSGEKPGLKKRFRMLMRMTSFRLTLIFLLIFLLFSAILVSASIYLVTNVLHREARSVINQELVVLRQSYRRGGLNALVRSVNQRSRAPGASLYLVIGPDSRVFAGNVKRLPAKVLERSRFIVRPFDYELLDGVRRPRRNGQAREGDDGKRAAIARVVELERGVKLLVGRDFGQPSRFRSIVMGTLLAMVFALTVIALISWYFLGRRALRRIERVSNASQRIVDGDLSQRLPDAGTGDEFDRLAGSLNNMLAKIEKLDGGIKNMSDSVAHDLKTPLTRLRNTAEAALSKKGRTSAADYKHALEETISQSDQLIRIFNALLMISRVESGSQAGSLDAVNVRAVMEDIAELYEAVAEEAGVSLTLNIQNESKSWIVNGNRELLGQAISNLVENAIKYAAQNAVDQHDQNVTNLTAISLFLEADNGHIRLVVADNGPGIPEEDRDRVIGRFVRLEKSRTKPGSGLGLSLVNAVSKLHSGRLVLSNNNPGLRATMEIPCKVD